MFLLHIKNPKTRPCHATDYFVQPTPRKCMKQNLYICLIGEIQHTFSVRYDCHRSMKTNHEDKKHSRQSELESNSFLSLAP
jgi:hypothetical protein